MDPYYYCAKFDMLMLNAVHSNKMTCLLFKSSLVTRCLKSWRLNSPQISSGTGCWLGCISLPSPAPPCSCPQTPCTRPAGWPEGKQKQRRSGNNNEKV